ncbi:MAG TPA: pantoate--beta-alanine ligase [Bryobacteraceae bacterium]|jgi:pantoate--beta-alanine ligase|nr:pantoate--beta-alanine ligase [Bryobacteraceae bacterium]
MPDLATTIPEIRALCQNFRQSGAKIGFVPTMGALHEGHGALIDRAHTECDAVVVSIFVNPIQFDRQEDYDRYARNLAADLDFCGRRKVALVFAPSPGEMYPRAQRAFVEVTGMSEQLCGEFRPGHFRGVATVVAKLFNIVQPDYAYFGEKDIQQLAVIRAMVADLNMPIAIAAVPTVREPDGLALSSRNERLTPEQRKAAPTIYTALQLARNAIAEGVRDANAVKQTALAKLAEEPQLRPEYLEVVNSETMQPVSEVSGRVCVATAAWLGTTRLIDNVLWP